VLRVQHDISDVHIKCWYSTFDTRTVPIPHKSPRSFWSPVQFFGLIFGIRSGWNQRIDACALCLFQFSASTGSARATIRRSATFSHFLREGTSCGGVGARCAPLSRLRAGRVCGWVDRCWIVIWWYFSVLDRRLLCELRGGTVPRGPYARVSKFDIVQVFLGRPAFQWKHEGMASEPRFIRGRVDIGVGIKMACAASISLSLFLFLALSLSLSFSVYSSTMTPDSTMAHRCRCVATVSRAVNNDRADIANRVATTVASSSPCRPRKPWGPTGIDCCVVVVVERVPLYLSHWITATHLPAFVNSSISFAGFAWVWFPMTISRAGRRRFVKPLSLSFSLDWLRSANFFAAYISLSMARSPPVDFNFRSYLSHFIDSSSPSGHSSICPSLLPTVLFTCHKTTYLPVTQFPGASIERRGMESNIAECN